MVKTVVVIMGYFVWEENHIWTVWGEPPNYPGRLVTGAREMLEEHADIVVITGCGEEEDKEGVELMKDRLYQGVFKLKDFTIYPIFQQYTPSQIKEKLDRTICLEYRLPGDRLQTTERTWQNLANKYLKGEEIGRLVIVTSPDHMFRTWRDALEQFPHLIAKIKPVMSLTPYCVDGPAEDEIATVKEVIEKIVIVEPRLYDSVGQLAEQLLSLRNSQEALHNVSVLLKEYEG